MPPQSNWFADRHGGYRIEKRLHPIHPIVFRWKRWFVEYERSSTSFLIV